MDRVARWKEDTSEIVNIFVAVEGVLSQNIKKLKGGRTFIFGEKSHSAEKISNIHSVAKQQKKFEGDPSRKKISRKKSLAVPKKIGRGDPLVSPGMVCYAGKQEKPFWFSSLDQIVHFGAIIFCRTFVELFWSIRVDWKKTTIIFAFHFMKRRLKIVELFLRSFVKKKCFSSFEGDLLLFNTMEMSIIFYSYFSILWKWAFSMIVKNYFSSFFPAKCVFTKLSFW